MFDFLRTAGSALVGPDKATFGKIQFIWNLFALYELFVTYG